MPDSSQRRNTRASASAGTYRVVCWSFSRRSWAIAEECMFSAVTGGPSEIGLAVAAAAALGVALWWRRNPSACPYSQRFWVQAPHPWITRARLFEALAPSAGERLLEIGPGTGYYTLEVAPRAGTLDIFDLQQE